MKWLFSFLPLLLILNLPAFAGNEALLQEIIEKAKTSSSDSLVLIENGKTIHSDFFGGEDRLRNIQSITKSITALAIAVLLDDGKIQSLDTPMSQWLPEWQFDSLKSKITLRMIMSHTSGISDSTVENFFTSPDLVSVARNAQPVVPPGSRFEYSNVATTLLQVVVSKASKMKVEDFVNTRIFAPLGITEFFWKKDELGQEAISGGLSLRTADLIKIGQLILNNGFMNGTQVIQSKTLAILLQKSQDFKSYGLLWWLARPEGAIDLNDYQIFRAEGFGGQYITIYPAKNLIAVRTKDPKTLDESLISVQEFSEFRSLIGKWQ